MNLLAAVLILQEQQLLDGDVGEVIGDGRLATRLRRAAQEDDAVFEQQIAQRHLPLPGVVAITLNEWIHGPLDGGHGRSFGVNAVGWVESSGPT